jgi:hypothetical protein
MPDAVLDALAAFLRENVAQAAGRTYAGGLTKFEPKELERIAVPPLDVLANEFDERRRIASEIRLSCFRRSNPEPA